MQCLDKPIGEGRASYCRPGAAQDRKQSLAGCYEAIRVNVSTLCAIDDLSGGVPRLVDIVSGESELWKQTSHRMCG